MNVALIATSYLPPTARLQELVTCLEKNIQNEHIADIHLFVEEDKEKYDAALATEDDVTLQRLKAAVENPKITRVDVTHRSTYKRLFDYANQNLDGRIVIVSNADIWYDDTIARLEEVAWDIVIPESGRASRKEGVFLALSRSERSNHSPAASENSQDTWIFKAPIRVFPCNWLLGPRGSDNRLAHEANAAGYRVLNPCSVIKPHHLHGTQYRVGVTLKRLDGLMMRVRPCSWEEVARTS